MIVLWLSDCHVEGIKSVKVLCIIVKADVEDKDSFLRGACLGLNWGGL